MKLSGHDQITRQAVVEFISEFKRDAARQLTYTRYDPELGPIEHGPEHYAVLRDIIDVLTLGHWSNFAQQHHFMRRFDGQSPYQAYQDGCNWIQSNSLAFAKSVAKGTGSYNLAPLGYACHCLEDSFAHGHCSREDAVSDTQPGAISHVKMYAGAEKENHSHHDETWKNPNTGKLSKVGDSGHDGDKHYGELAKNAVKALLYVIFHEAYVARESNSTVNSLSRWLAFQSKWLAASPALSRERNQAYDLIDKYYSGFVWGDTNHAINFDEAGLAGAIYSQLQGDTTAVYNTFWRLNEYHTVDADDVAEIYVDKLRSNSATKSTVHAVARDSRLKNLLIKILDEGWTSDNEYACINFLKELK